MAGKQQGVWDIRKAIFELGIVRKAYFFKPFFAPHSVFLFEGVNSLEGEGRLWEGDIHFSGTCILGVCKGHRDLIGFTREGFIVAEVGAQLVLIDAVEVISVSVLVAIRFDIYRPPEFPGGVCTSILLVVYPQSKGRKGYFFSPFIFSDTAVVPYLEATSALVNVVVVEVAGYSEATIHEGVEQQFGVHVVVNRLVPSKVLQTESFHLCEVEVLRDNYAGFSVFGDGIEAKREHKRSWNPREFQVGNARYHEFVGDYF